VIKLTGQISVDWLDKVEPAFVDGNVDGVFMWIESGGGSVQEAQLLTHGLLALKSKYSKPLYIYTEYALMSGAYWAAMAADSIFAAPSAEVGSIGVWLKRVDETVRDSINGVTVYTFRSAELKTVGDPHVRMTLNEAWFLSIEVQRVYVEFLKVVYGRRFDNFARALFMGNKLFYSAEDSLGVREFLVGIASGRSYDAELAYSAGLIDGVGYFDEIVIQFVKKGWFVVNKAGSTVGLFR
jgi:protease-4